MLIYSKTRYEILNDLYLIFYWLNSEVWSDLFIFLEFYALLIWLSPYPLFIIIMRKLTLY